MLTETYIEALLVDEDLADRVWGLWNAGLIPDDVAALAWWLMTARQPKGPAPKEETPLVACSLSA